MAKKTPTVFPDRVVLAEGYPWAIGAGPKYNTMAMSEAATGIKFEELKFPREFWSSEVPKYRLVLERVGAKPKGRK